MLEAAHATHSSHASHASHAAHTSAHATHAAAIVMMIVVMVVLFFLGNTTVGLRQEAALLEDRIEADKNAREKAEAKLKSNIAAINTELIEKEKKLIAALQTVAALTKTKNSLEFDILALKIRMEQLEKDVALTKRRRNRTPRGSFPPRLNP